MEASHDVVDEAVRSVEKLRRGLRKSTTGQVRSSSEKSLAKASAFAWFNNFRPIIVSGIDDLLVADLDTAYRELLGYCDHHTSRAKYLVKLKEIKNLLASTKDHVVVSHISQKQLTDDEVPNFSNLVKEPDMAKILEARWLECAICVKASAPLAATVVMGGLLEALLLARIHRETDKSMVFGAASAPTEKGTGKPAPLQKWTLKHYIDVAHELGWISSSAKDVGAVMRDYRNYIHPHKEFTHAIKLTTDDAELFWEIAKGMSRQILSK